jgi:hypothetical protein
VDGIAVVFIVLGIGRLAALRLAPPSLVVDAVTHAALALAAYWAFQLLVVWPDKSYPWVLAGIVLVGAGRCCEARWLAEPGDQRLIGAITLLLAAVLIAGDVALFPGMW